MDFGASARIRPGVAGAAGIICLVVAVMILAAGCAGRRKVVESYPAEDAADTEIDGVRIRFLDFNRNVPDLPIVYIHGYSGTGFEAFFFQDNFATKHRVIAPDLPGSGWSDKPDIEYTLEYMVRFVSRFVDTLGIRRFYLIGHSMGGQIAVTYAAQNPERVERLVLIAPYGLHDEAGRLLSFLSRTGSLVDAGMRLHSRLLLDLVVDLNVFHDPDRIPPDFVDYVSISTFDTQNGLGALASITRNIITETDVEDVLSRIEMPTLIIWGADDQVLSFRYAADFDSGIRGSRLVAIPSCGHMPHLECQAETAAAIETFLTTP